MTITIDLPVPPSVNKIWTIGKDHRGRPNQYLNKKYQQWIKDADWSRHLSAARNKKIIGPYKVRIILDHNIRGDLDNRIKAFLDWAGKRAGITSDDKLCAGLAVEWGTVPAGCRLKLRKAHAAPSQFLDR